MRSGTASSGAVDLFCDRLETLVNIDTPSDGVEQERVGELLAEWLAPLGDIGRVDRRAGLSGAQRLHLTARRGRGRGRTARPRRHRLPAGHSRRAAVPARGGALLRPRRRRHEGRPGAGGDGDGGVPRPPSLSRAAADRLRRRGGAAARSRLRGPRRGRHGGPRLRVRPRERRPGLGAQGRAVADDGADGRAGARGGGHRPRTQRRQRAGPRDRCASRASPTAGRR